MATVGDNGQLLNTLVRMVVPMRREFGHHLDIQHFMADRAYADAVLNEALASQDPRLRDYASYVRSRLLGARMAMPPSPQPPAAATAVPDAPTDAESLSEEEMRARVLRKYTNGLR